MLKRTLGLTLLSSLMLASAQTGSLSIKHETGTYTAAQAAKRVVVLEYSFLDSLIVVGVPPVGAAIGTQAGDRGAPPYLRSLLGGITEVGSRAAMLTAASSSHSGMGFSWRGVKPRAIQTGALRISC